MIDIVYFSLVLPAVCVQCPVWQFPVVPWCHAESSKLCCISLTSTLLAGCYFAARLCHFPDLDNSLLGPQDSFAFGTERQAFVTNHIKHAYEGVTFLWWQYKMKCWCVALRSLSICS